MTTNDFGREALELCEDAFDISSNPRQEDAIRLIRIAINEMQSQHHEALSAAQGDWIDFDGELPSTDCWVQLSDGSTIEAIWDYTNGYHHEIGNRSVIRWFQPAEPPPPPPIQGSAIEVDDLAGEGDESFMGWIQKAYNAARLPLMQENAELKRKLKEAGL